MNAMNSNNYSLNFLEHSCECSSWSECRSSEHSWCENHESNSSNCRKSIFV